MSAIAICATQLSCQGQEKLLDTTSLRSDFRELMHHLTLHHPGLYRHTDKAVLDSISEHAFRSIQTPMSDWDFYRLLAPVIAAIRCGHTLVLPSEKMRKEFSEQGRFFPLKTLFSEKTMYVQLADSTWARVLELNGEPIQDLLQRMTAQIATDGIAEIPKYDLLRGFWRYYARLIDLYPAKFSLLVKRTGAGVTKVIELQPVSEAVMTHAIGVTKKQLIPALEVEVKGRVGYLRIESFSNHLLKKDFAQFLHQSFKTLREQNIAQLIVDIRGNQGGEDENGALLYSYLSKTPFHYFKTVLKKERNGFSKVHHPCLVLQQPQTLAFDGSLCLLVDGLSFSTAADVAAIIKNNKRGIIIGRETSGGFEGNNSGESFTLQLTHSSILIHIPGWYYENAVDRSVLHRGVIPDKIVYPDVSDFILGRDVMLEVAMNFFH